MSSAKNAVVCIVDDVESVRKSIGAVLETADIVVRDYASAGEFLAAFTPGTVGCLIIDHHMPDMTGLELLQLLQAQGVAPPTVLITGHGDKVLRERVLEAGGLAMLNKPVDGDELIILIERVIANDD